MALAHRTGWKTLGTLAGQYGVTRQAIWKIIKQAGVSIKDQAAMLVSCTACGESIRRTRGRIRTQVNHFCGYGCYTAYLRAGKGTGAYQPSRHGQRLARKVVSKLFTLLPGHVVHHEDRNCYHNTPDNLRVFANQGDHIRYHRLGPAHVMPIWGGGK